MRVAQRGEFGREVVVIRLPVQRAARIDLFARRRMPRQIERLLVEGIDGTEAGRVTPG